MADVTVKDINVQAVETPTYLWGVNAVGRACKVIPWAYPVTSVVGLTGAITQGDLRTALGLGNAAYLNTGTGAGTVAVGNHTHTPASLGAEPTIATGTSAQYWRGDKVWSTLDKAAVGLNNVDNTADADKPISSAASSALSGKEPTITAGTTGQYWRGDKTWATFPSIQVPVQYNEEGIQVAAAGSTSIINFTGAGVDTSFAGNTLTVNVPNSGGGGWTAVDATDTVKGILKLTNDLGGTADLPVVAKINGVAISGTCASGNVITGDSASTASWKTLASAGIAPTASPTFTGDLTLSSVGARIRGDFSNATHANRVAFQSNVSDGLTVVPFLPNGASVIAGLTFHSNADTDNSQWGGINCIGGSAVNFVSTYLGTPGVALPMVFSFKNVERVRILPTGEVGIGVTPQVGKGTLQVPDINGGQLAGNRRLNRNGNFDIWQRGAGPFTATGYTADGWIADIAAGTVAVSHAGFQPGDYYGVTRPKYVLRWNQTVAGAGNSLEFRIPDVRKLDAKTITVSFYAAATSGTVSAYAQSRQYFGTGGSTTFYSTTQGFTVTTTRTKFTATFDLPSIVNKTIGTGDYGMIVLGWPTAAFDVYISEFQIEYGAVATPFELWDSAVELAACKRWLRVQAVRVNTSATPTCMTIDMAGVPTLSGGGTGFTSTGTTADTLICYQTTAAVQTITMTCEV